MKPIIISFNIYGEKTLNKNIDIKSTIWNVANYLQFRAVSIFFAFKHAVDENRFFAAIKGKNKTKNLVLLTFVSRTPFPSVSYSRNMTEKKRERQMN